MTILLTMPCMPSDRRRGGRAPRAQSSVRRRDAPCGALDADDVRSGGDLVDLHASPCALTLWTRGPGDSSQKSLFPLVGSHARALAEIGQKRLDDISTLAARRAGDLHGHAKQ